MKVTQFINDGCPLTVTVEEILSNERPWIFVDLGMPSDKPRSPGPELKGPRIAIRRTDDGKGYHILLHGDPFYVFDVGENDAHEKRARKEMLLIASLAFPELKQLEGRTDRLPTLWVYGLLKKETSAEITINLAQPNFPDEKSPAVGQGR